MIARVFLAAALFLFTPSTDAGAVHVCRAWVYELLTVPCHSSAGIASCSYVQGPTAIGCDVAGNAITFPDPGPFQLTMARVYAIWPAP